MIVANARSHSLRGSELDVGAQGGREADSRNASGAWTAARLPTSGSKRRTAMLLSVGSDSRPYHLIDGSRASRRERILKAGTVGRAARRASPRLGPVTLFSIAGMA